MGIIYPHLQEGFLLSEDDLNNQTIALQRSSSLIAALSEVATEIQSVLDPEQIFKILNVGLKQLKADHFVDLVDPQKQDLVIQYLGIESKALAAAEKLAGLDSRGYRIPRKNFPVYEDLVDQQNPQ